MENDTAVKDKIEVIINDFIDSVAGQDLTPLETLGVLSYLTGLYQRMILDQLEILAKEEVEKA